MQIQQLRMRLDHHLERIQSQIDNRLKRAKAKAQGQAELLTSLSPVAILGRGYSLTFTESGELVKSVDSVRTGQKLQTRVADGTIDSVAEAVSATKEVSPS